jgi:hypothetical protein
MTRLLAIVIALGFLAIGIKLVEGGGEEPEPCNSLREARKLHPGIHLRRQGKCWGWGLDRGRRKQKEPPRPAQPIVVIQPWRPEPRPLFLPWEERVEPNIHWGAR